MLFGVSFRLPNEQLFCLDNHQPALLIVRARLLILRVGTALAWILFGNMATQASRKRECLFAERALDRNC